MAANETAAIAACKAFAEAEEIYHRTDYNHDGVLEYAQFLHGTSSLLENVAGSGDLGLLDGNFAKAEGYSALGWQGGGGASPLPTPKDGYLFAVVYQQGPSATGGQRSYLSNGAPYNPGWLPPGVHMTLGYAFSAIPSAYDVTGRNSFMISNNGVIFQCDRGAAGSVLHPSLFDPTPNVWQTAD
jgi:hypothetical protein